MNLKRVFFSIALAGVLFQSSLAFAQSQIIKDFLEAMDQRNDVLMTKIVEDNKAKIPAEIKALLDENLKPETTAEAREENFFVAESLARTYKEVTDDAGILKDVKKKSFESRLGAAARPAPVDGFFIMEFPAPTDAVKNVFKPDNIFIPKGSSVRWVNKDIEGHVFSTVPFISDGGFMSPRIEPEQTWEYKFENPGEYYLICFVHHAMIGKVTVEDKK